MKAMCIEYVNLKRKDITNATQSGDLPYHKT